MVLLWATQRLAPGRVVAAHVNHNVHPEADAWRRLVESYARSRGIAFVTTTLDIHPSGNFEHNARQARHAWLAGLLQSGDWLLLAHQRNDQAETALLRLLQGRGSYGMPARRQAGLGLLVRPLLGLPRSILEAAAAEQGLPSVADPANRDTAFDRVWLREEILPRFAERDARSHGRLADAAERALDREAAALAIARTLPEPLPATDLPVEPGPAAEFLRWWLLARGGVSPPVGRLRTWWLPALQGAGTLPALALANGKLLLYRGALYWNRDGAVPQDFPLEPGSGERALSHGCLWWADVKPDATFVVRFNQPGLRMLRGSARVTVRSLLQSAVLPWERARYPLVCRGDVVVCIPGVASTLDRSVGRFEYLPGFPVLRPDRRPPTD